ncbi:MAG TPA: hypothetical protein VGV38_17375 [Pyrinomonadaceae bacterium]|nr:hypothetical protein [Pyrinomonadaceae bacterium]
MREILIQQVQPEPGGPLYGKSISTDDYMKSQEFAHDHVEVITRDFLVRGAAAAQVAGFDYQLPGGLQFSVGAGQAVTVAGVSHETLPVGQASVVQLAAAHVAQPRIDLVYGLLEADVPAELEFRPFRRKRTEAEIVGGVEPFPPTQFQQPTQRHTRVTVQVRQGVPDAAPVAPNANANEVPLFHVRVNAGAVALAAPNITDVRNVARSLYQLGADVAALTGGALHETIDDRVAALLIVTPNTGLSKVYDDAGNLLTLAGVSATQAAMGMMSAADKTKLDNAVELVARRGQANGYASLGADGLVPAAQLPPSDLSSRVAKAGDTMTGALKVNTGGVALVAGAAAASGLNKRAHVHGGLSIGAGVQDTQTPVNGLLVEGSFILGNQAPVAGERLGVYSGDTAAFVARFKNTAVNGLGIRVSAGENAPQHTLIEGYNRDEDVLVFRVSGSGQVLGRAYWAAEGAGASVGNAGPYLFDGHGNYASSYGIRVRAGSSGDHPLLVLQTYDGVPRLHIAASGILGLGTGLPNVSGVGGRLHVAGDTIRIDTQRSPASNGIGNPGEVCWDGNYIYVCVAANTWKRAALAAY